jgi:hypothetical protein
MGHKLSVDKAALFAEDAREAGWETDVIRNGAKSTAKATREKDGAVISISWEGEKCLNESTITIDGHTKKLRNASACRQALAGEQAVPKPKIPKSQSSRRPAQDNASDDEDVDRRMPDPAWGREHAEDPNELILKSVAGKTITWVNERRRAVESAVVPKEPRQLKIVVSPLTRRRTITFAAQGDRFRSLYIERIVSVA